MSEIDGITKKFTIGNHDCYLHVGVDNDGNVCRLDLTISKGHDEMRCYEVLMLMANHALSRGCELSEIAGILIGHRFPPDGFVSENGEGHYYGSICDYIGKYLVNNFLRSNLS
jgi:hypothetical protein